TSSFSRLYLTYATEAAMPQASSASRTMRTGHTTYHGSWSGSPRSEAARRRKRKETASAEGPGHHLSLIEFHFSTTREDSLRSSGVIVSCLGLMQRRVTA